MNSNDIKKSKEDIQQRNNAIVNRMMVMFILATAAVVALLMIKRNGSRVENVFVLQLLPYFQIVSGVLLAGAIAFFAVQRKRHVNDSLKIFSSSTLLMLAVILFAVFMLYKRFNNTAMVVLIIASLVVSFVYNFYQRDFYYYTVFAVLNLLFVYFIRFGITSILWKDILFIISIILIFVLPIATVGFLLYAKSKKGIVKFNGKNHTIMKPSYLYYPFYVGAVIAIASGVFGLLFTSYIIYLIIAQLAAYLLFGIIYTIKMI